MKELNCLIVDDEPIARDVIANFCGHFNFIKIVSECRDALEARHTLQTKKIDLMFLDIHMPVLDGMNFLKTLKNPPLVIFTTAFKDYASQAFDLAACDYLVKPFAFDRFVIAIDKVVEKLAPTLPFEIPNVVVTANLKEYIFLKAEGRIYKLFYHEILFAEANGNNTKIVTENKLVTAPIKFNQLEASLPKEFFIRTHRSFLINKSKIKHIEGNFIAIHDNEIPIGHNYREHFLKDIGF